MNTENLLPNRGYDEPKVEQTFTIIKPDGMQKGVLGEILQELTRKNLRVTGALLVHLDPKWVRQLYALEKDKEYYDPIVQWVSSAAVLIMTIQGPNAINELKWNIIGRHPNGIRGKYAESWMKNIAHAPDSVESVQRELFLVSQIFATERNKRGNNYFDTLFVSDP